MRPNMSLSKQTQLLALFALTVVIAGVGIQIRENKNDGVMDTDTAIFKYSEVEPVGGVGENEPFPVALPSPSVILPVSEDQPVSAVKSDISAEAYIVGNLETGEVYLSKNPDRVYPIASISKLFTVMTARDVFNSTDEIKITEDMLEPYGSTTGILDGVVFTALELEYPLVIESSNDVALVFAMSHGYDKFIEQMNAYAKEIGLDSTSFNEPSGLSPRNVSTANDLFDFAQYLNKSAKDILEISRTPVYTIPATDWHPDLTFKNTNVFVGDPSFIGGKTGRTNEALETMLSLFKYEIEGKEYPLAIVVLRSGFNMRQLDTAVLIEKFFQTLE